MPASWRFILMALAATLAAAPLAPAPALAAYERPSTPDDDRDGNPDDADGAFLGGPDPPWLLPFVLLFWMGVLVVTVALVAIGAVAAGFLLVVGLALVAVGAVVAAWLLLQGTGALAALAILPGLLVTVWIIVRRPSRPSPAWRLFQNR